MRELPKAIETEQELLGLIINKNSLMNKVVNELKADDFYLDKHIKLFKTMQMLFAAGTDITVVTILEKIGKKRIAEVGGINYIAEIENYKIYSSLDALIKIIKDKSVRRKAIKETAETLEKLYDEEIEAKETFGKLQATTFVDAENKQVEDKELFLIALEEIEQRYQNGGEIPGMKTGLKDFDKATNGLKGGELFVIGARPSMGKTVTAINILDGLADNGYRSGLIELEMTEAALGRRRLAYNAFIEANKLQTGDLTDDEVNKLTREANRLMKRNMIITDCSNYQDILTVKAKAKAMKNAYGIKVLAIDHLGLMDLGKNENRSVAIGEVTRQLKLLAKELDITIIVLSQLSRAVEQRADKRPMLSDLRESGNIEQDADLVMFLYRDEYYNNDSDDKGTIEWIVSKQRDGKTGVLKFAYLEKYQKIGDMEV